MAAPKKLEVVTVTSESPTVKDARFHAGVELMNSATSCNCKKADIFERPNGLLCVSKKERRSVFVPYANIRCYELL